MNTRVFRSYSSNFRTRIFRKMNRTICYFSTIFLLLYKISGYHSLKNVRLKTNPIVKAGETLALECDYDLENALLYSIKWYFGDQEFYRFVPKESPPTRVFPLPAISVDLSKSDNKLVVLRDVQRDQTGYYKCEVSADAPLFHTDIKMALIIVAVTPEEPPKISTEKIKISQKEIIKASCSSSKSYPSANLTWFINGHQVRDDKFVKVKNTVNTEIGSLESSNSQLEIRSPYSGVFVDGKLRLRCEATQFDIYKQSTEIEIVDDTPQLAQVLSPTPIPGHAVCCKNSKSAILSAILAILIINR